jgi:hypothetical protein
MVLEVFRRNPHIKSYIRYYRGYEPELLGTLLSEPLYLHHLTIPPSRSPPQGNFQRTNWLSKLHEDVVIEDIHLELSSECDEWLLCHMDKFKGLKSLCVQLCAGDYYVNDPTYYRSSSSRILSLLWCLELEHLALWSVDNLRLAPIGTFPELRSLYIKLRPDWRDRPFPFSGFDDLVDALKTFKDRNIFLSIEAKRESSEEVLPQQLLYRLCFQYATVANVDPTPFIQWLARSAFFFADFYGPSYDPVEIDLRELDSVERLQKALQAVKSLDSCENLSRGIWVRLRISNSQYVEIANSMPTSICRLEIIFGGPEVITPSVAVAIISALPQLVQLCIVVSADKNVYTSTVYPRFTNSHFSRLLPFLSEPPLRVTLKPGQPVRGEISSYKLEHNKVFFTELMGYFDVNSALREIQLELAPRWPYPRPPL